MTGEMFEPEWAKNDYEAHQDAVNARSKLGVKTIGDQNIYATEFHEVNKTSLASTLSEAYDSGKHETADMTTLSS